jgi:hypothetical protein
MGPWNVREYAGVGLVILDWEYAAWAPMATDEVWHAVSFRLATGRRSGERVGAEVREELASFYSDSQLQDAAAFLAGRWGREEPAEIRHDLPKSKALLRSEKRLSRALGQFIH